MTLRDFLAFVGPTLQAATFVGGVLFFVFSLQGDLNLVKATQTETNVKVDRLYDLLIFNKKVAQFNEQ